MTAVTVEHISKKFPLEDLQSVHALQDVSLYLAEGDSLAIVGPSGCGKTTLLRIIAGLEKPDSGRVLYDHIPLAETVPQDRGIGMVFQNFALIPQWEAERNIGFFLSLRKREHEIPERVRRVSAITGIDIQHLLGRLPSQLSGGEKQRVAIARAFARDLRLLLFDEPFANLDAKFRQNARLQARRLLDQYPVTSIYVTHDQHEASMMARRIAFMREGRVEQLGTYAQLYESPATIHIARSIGVPLMNLFYGWAENGYWMGENFGGYPIRRDLAEGTRLIMGIRPHHIHLNGEIPAVIDQITPYYAERFTLLDVHLGKEQWQIQVPLEHGFQRGETLYCNIQVEEAIYFDRDTGLRIG
jgi:ABC-type sugar transport system ATPase subunit